MTDIAIPTVHRNGTSRAVLMHQLIVSINAIDDAELALQQACPNGRDYYPQGANAIQEALRQHATRLHNLRAVATELRVIAESFA